MSTVQFRTQPTFTEQMAEGIRNSSKWYRYLQQNELGTPPSPEIIVKIGASPYSYQAPHKGFVILSGGTVSNVMFSRSAGQFYLTGATSGLFPMAQNDVLKVTFTGSPSFVWVPT